MPDDITRRSLLQLLSACGLSLTLPGMSARAANRRSSERPKSLITLWMNGGMSQLETWDPHPGTVTGGDTKDIATTAKDIRISDMLPQMAEQMRSCLLIRSLTSKEGDHERGLSFVKTGYRPEPTLKYPTLGAIAAHELPDPGIEIPPYVALASGRVIPEGGYLGNEWDAFRVFHPGDGLSNLKASVSEPRQVNRLRSLSVVSRQFEHNRSFGAQRTLHQDTLDRALKMMSSEQLKAFELDSESASVKAAYGATSFGRGCLVARRLVEVGVRSIEVNLSGFDTHVSNHEGHITQTKILDPAIATLIRELRERHLLESTIVLCISEFGRTPSINPAGGRDHWPNWFSCMISGGGFREGTVIGATPSDLPKENSGMMMAGKSTGAGPIDPISVPELYATIMAIMGIDPQKEIMTPIGRPIRFADARPSARLLKDEVAAKVIRT
ncbi:MAG: DUF1501 domain-containing protein [Planctomycetota bacterium]